MAGVWRCAVVVMAVCMCLGRGSAGGAKSRPRPTRPPYKEPTEAPKIDDTLMAKEIDLNQMGGTWYLASVASKCPFLLKHGMKVEATVMTLTLPSKPNEPLSVSTTTRHLHQCWTILQVYILTATPGRFVLDSKNPLLTTNIVVGDTDYGSYAILYYRRQGQLTMKLYSRSKDTLSDDILDKFEDLAQKEDMGLAYIVPFPNYSHCESTDKDHVINCIPVC